MGLDGKQIAEIYQPMFDYFRSNHGIILIVSEMDEIVRLSNRVVGDFNRVIAKQQCEHDYIKSASFKGMLICNKCRTYKPEGA